MQAERTLNERIVRVDMARRIVREEPLPPAWARLGGRAMCVAVAAAEIPPDAKPLGPANRLVFAPGLLAGTGAPCADRLSIAAKSPLTGTLRESNAGGGIARLLAGLGIRALIVEGAPKGHGWYALHIDADGVAVREERTVVGQGIDATVAAVRNRPGPTPGLMAIGPGGEMEMAAANVSLADANGPVRKVGRGGLGAVFGSKRIKLITFVGSNLRQGTSLGDMAAFEAARKSFVDALARRGDGRPIALVPGPECRAECGLAGFEVFHDQGGHQLSAWPNAVDPWSRGAAAWIESAELADTADRLMDDIGLDSIETGVMFGMAMDAGILAPNDGHAVVRLLRDEIAPGTALGRVLGGGSAVLRRVYPSVDRLTLPSRDRATASDRRAATALGDSLGMCIFLAVPAAADSDCRAALRAMADARLGLVLSDADWHALGGGILATEDRFARAVGARDDAAEQRAVWNGGGADVDSFWGSIGFPGKG